MKVVIRLTRGEELKALPIIYRHSAAVVLPNATYVLSESAVTALRDAGVSFEQLARDAAALSGEEVMAGERI